MGRHVCTLVDDAASFGAAALQFLQTGLEAGERLVCVTDHPAAAVARDLAGLGDVPRLIDMGALSIHSTAALYQPDGTFDLDGQVARYGTLTDQALAAGYTGLRVAADATKLVPTTEARHRFLRYEVAVDRLMARAPMSAMCAYDVSQLGSAVAELCAVHEHDDAPSTMAPGFRLSFASAGLRLAGELDMANRELFALALDAALACAEQVLVIDASELTFIDVRTIVDLGELRTSLLAHGRDVRLTNSRPVVRRCAALLDVDIVLDSGADGGAP